MGTKRIIEKYIDEVIKSLRTIYMADPNSLSIEKKLEFFSETRHAYGRTALLLSGGATFGKYHFGLLKALHEQDLLPRLICGSSVGSIVCAVLASKPPNRVHEIFDPAEVFKYPILGFLPESNWDLVRDLLNRKVVLSTETLKEFIYRFTGDLTFKEIFMQNGWNLNITVTDFAMNVAPRLLNYLTAPNVLVWSAVCASCAIPGLYAKVDLM